MQKTLRFLGLAAVIGAVAIVVAQSSPRSKGQDPNQTQIQGGAAANPQQGTNFSNSALELMSQYFCFKQNVAIDRASEAGRQDRVDALIKMNCTALLWIQTPAQQRASIAHMEIEKYRPNDAKWREVARTPSLLKALVTIDKAVEAKVEEMMTMVWKPILEQDREFDLQLMKSAAYKNAKDQQERNILHYEGLKVWRLTHPIPPLAERQAATLGRYEKAMAETEKLLKGAQLNEWKMFRSKYEAAFKIALNGDRP